MFRFPKDWLMKIWNLRTHLSVHSTPKSFLWEERGVPLTVSDASHWVTPDGNVETQFAVTAVKNQGTFFLQRSNVKQWFYTQSQILLGGKGRQLVRTKLQNLISRSGQDCLVSNLGAKSFSHSAIAATIVLSLPEATNSIPSSSIQKLGDCPLRTHGKFCG